MLVWYYIIWTSLVILSNNVLRLYVREKLMDDISAKWDIGLTARLNSSKKEMTS